MCCSTSPIRIVTVDSPEQEILRTKTIEIGPDELPLAQSIAEKLVLALTPYFPAAGLAAPQIGSNRSVFIYSYDRRPENLEWVFNPTFVPLGNERVEGWEGCLSVIATVWKLAKVSRYEKIMVTYLNKNGKKIEKPLEGFAAKVFQHEYDHLQGVVNIERPDAVIQSFNSKDELLRFMQAVKKEDSQHYKKPT